MTYAQALTLSSVGYPVFPCGADKRPLVAGGFQAATTDQEIIREWWQTWPNALIGVPTGQRTGIYVLDLDVKPGKNGPAALQALGIVPPPTRVHVTQSGGYHLLYLADQINLNKTDSDVIATGVDRRGDGGYIIWWPAHGCHIIDAHFAPAPEWMRQGARAVPHDQPELPPLGLTDEQVDALMEMIPVAQMASRAEWIKVGMALHHEFGGDAAGLQTWDAWSSRWPKYEGVESLEREWRTFGRGQGAHVTIRSFVPAGWLRMQGLPEPTEVFGKQAAPVDPPAVLTADLPAVPLAAPALPQGMRDARDGTATTRPLTEHGNAMRLYDRDGRDLRYVPETKGWLYWRHTDNGSAWQWDTDGAIPRTMALRLAGDIYTEATGNIAEADTYAKWARKTQELRTAKASVAILSDMQPLRLPITSVDTDTMVAGLDQGRMILDLRTGTTRCATQRDYVTKSLSVSHIGDPRACHRWLTFLAQVFNGDKELIEWMQRYCGYLLTGSTKEQFFAFAFGTGRNGKGTFAELLKYLLGDYTRTIASATLSEAKRSAGGASPDVASLAGARLVISSETEDGVPLNESFMKNATGGDTMSARPLYGAPFEFAPQFKILMLGNHKPVIKGTDYAMWSRVRLIPFVRTFDETHRDPDLQSKLREEGPDIVAWMLEGCLRWQQQGLQDIPAAIREATVQYREEMDTMGIWLEDCCGIDPDRVTTTAMLYESFKNWSTANGFRFIMTARVFGRRLSDRGYKTHRTETTRSWQGIYLKLQ